MSSKRSAKPSAASQGYQENNTSSNEPTKGGDDAAMPDWAAREAEADQLLREPNNKAEGPTQQHGTLQQEGAALLKHRIPDRTYPPELVATIAANLLRGDKTDDYELAVHQALRLLDTTHRILNRPTNEDDWKRIPWDEALKQITGAVRPSNAQKRLIERLSTRGVEYIDYNMVKEAKGPEGWEKVLKEKGQGAGIIPETAQVPEGHDPEAEPGMKRRVPTQVEINKALVDCRENGIPQWRVKLLREQYLKDTAHIRSKNFLKKKKKRD
jgi:hypothetical protein